MINLGRWRWAAITACPVATIGFFFISGILKPLYRSESVLAITDQVAEPENEIAGLRLENIRRHAAEAGAFDPSVNVERSTDRPSEIVIGVLGRNPTSTWKGAQAAASAVLEDSLKKRRETLDQKIKAVEAQRVSLRQDLESFRNEELRLRLEWTPAAESDADTAAQIKDLQRRVTFLTEHFQYHPDLAILERRLIRLKSKAGYVSSPLNEAGRKIAELQSHLDIVSRDVEALAEEKNEMQPAWRIIQPATKPTEPFQIAGWPFAAGAALISMIAAFLLIKGSRGDRRYSLGNAVWNASSNIPLSILSHQTPSLPAQSEIPSDPLSQQAAMFFDRWRHLITTLYEPSAEPPTTVVADTEALLAEMLDFLPSGHAVLARHLAHTVSEGSLSLHVTRTVLMALLGAQEAGVSPALREGLVFAALFHDLAIVPRAPWAWQAVGPEVGRLSIAILAKVPGLQAATRDLIERILVGMDEHKTDMWQNMPHDKDLEPVSNLLRQIDGFEKVMQNQKSQIEQSVAQVAAR